jgi:hypothetical protein
MTTRRYIGPVIIAEDEAAPKKERRITIYKNEVFKDIDLYTHKHVDAHEEMGLRSANAVSSDNSESVDGSVIARYVEFRDAQLRRRLRFALASETKECADDDITLESNVYRYDLLLPQSFDDNTLRAVAEYFHRFLVFGALYDWYSQFGMAQAGVYGQELKELEEEINSVLRGPSIVKRPMQPFGPAHKFM